jgi:hypothetical protein
MDLLMRDCDAEFLRLVDKRILDMQFNQTNHNTGYVNNIRKEPPGSTMERLADFMVDAAEREIESFLSKRSPIEQVAMRRAAERVAARLDESIAALEHDLLHGDGSGSR